MRKEWALLRDGQRIDRHLNPYDENTAKALARHRDGVVAGYRWVSDWVEAPPVEVSTHHQERPR